MIRTILRRVLLAWWLIIVGWPIIFALDWLFESKSNSANEFANYLWYGLKGLENDD